MGNLTIEKIRNAVGADYDCVYELNARTKDELGDMIRFLVGYINQAEKASHENELISAGEQYFDELLGIKERHD